MDAETIRWAVGFFLVFVGSSTVLTVKNPNYYERVVSSIYFKTLYVLGISTFIVHFGVQVFSKILLIKLKDSTQAITVIKDTWESYSANLIWFGFILFVFGIHWLILNFISRATIKYNNNKT